MTDTAAPVSSFLNLCFRMASSISTLSDPAYDTLDNLSVKEIHRSSMLQRLYTPMKVPWQVIWNELERHGLEKIELLDTFLALCYRCRFTEPHAQQTFALRQLSWSWYHTTTPGVPSMHVEAKVLTTAAGKRAQSSVMLIVSELLTVVDTEDMLSNRHHALDEEEFWIDQISSEANWRRGLHSERSALSLCS